MGKLISEGLLPPDDPIFSGGLETFSIRRPKPQEEAPKPDEKPPDDEEESK